MSKILIINNGLAGGGIERASTSMANQFVKWEHEVYIVALYRSEHFLPIDKRIHFVEPESVPKSKLYVVKMIAYIRKMVKRINPDTILAYNEWTNPYVGLALTGLKYPLFFTDRMNPLGKTPKLTEFLKKRYYPQANGIIAQTQFAKKIISEKTGAKNITVIPNPINCIDGINCEKKNIIVTVGRLTKEKGHKILIEAFAKVQDKSWKLSIVGDGRERQSLEKLAVDLRIQDRVIFHGHQANFNKQLSEAKIFVLPSLSEGFPNALIEAMSVPLPCIATICTPGIKEVVEDEKNALLVEKNNANALADTINRLVLDESLREKLASNAYHVRENLAFEKIAGKYLNYILNVQQY